MAEPIYIINGPNLNLLGDREPEIYGTTTLDDIRAMSEKRAQARGMSVDFRQSNHEGVMIDWIQEARSSAAGIVINPGAFTHTSIALMDALLAVKAPIIELHLSNIFKREEFRHHSFVAAAATATICGLGAKGYEVAIDAMADLCSQSPNAG